jgi:hypothetical protein
MSDQEVVMVLREFRRALEMADDDLLERLADMYVMIERRLASDIELLARVMAERAANGQAITQQMLWTEERYQSLMAQLEVEVRRFNASADERIRRGQLEMGGMGIEAGSEAISAVWQGSFHRINTRAIEALVGYTADGTPLHTLLAEDYGEAVSALSEALINGVARGSNPAVVAKEMTNGMGVGFQRATLISRTEMARAFRAGSAMQYSQSGVVTAQQRLVKKETACLACLFLDGEILPIERPLEDHPAGKCVSVPVVNGGVVQWENGMTWFMRQDAERQMELLGEGRYNAWQNGQFELSQVAQHSHSDVWGEQPRVATDQELGM